MADKTKIIVHQSLHGYQNGHQLIASSREFASEVKKTLVYQTDLSGSYVDKGFETYLFGFPIPGELTYAFCRSWYANEMKRPGCVWTHTLYIQHADIGKFPELSLLLKYFERPTQGDFQFYKKQIELQRDNVLAENSYRPTNNDFAIMSALYNFPEKVILISADASSAFENAIVNVWSNQWPRLRRNFTFSTGSLGIRSLEGKEFDLQVIPEVTKTAIERQAKNAITLKVSDEIDADLVHAYLDDKQGLREFLWTFGADVVGERINYLPLVRAFNLIRNPESTFVDIVEYLRENFPESSSAKYLKKEIFGKDSILGKKVSEQDLILFLLSSEDLDFLPFSDLALDDRLLEVIEIGELNLPTIINNLRSIKSERISTEISNLVDFSKITIEQLLKLDENIISQVLDKVIGLAISPLFWQMSSDIHRKALEVISREISSNNWYNYITAILESRSDAIFIAYRALGNSVIYCSLDWLNEKGNRSLTVNWQEYLVNNCFDVFKSWIHRNEDALSAPIFILLFKQNDFEKTRWIKLHANTWIRAYDTMINLVNKNEFVNVACHILSIGLNNLAYRSDLLVERSFTDVFYFAKNSNISQNIWYNLPKDQLPMDDGDISLFTNPIGALVKMLTWNAKPARDVPNWDYCEILIRTVSTKFIKHGWSRQSYLRALKSEEVFMRSLSFCVESNKGEKFLNAVYNDIRHKRINPLPFQWNLLNSGR